jgi:hypothetical protein
VAFPILLVLLAAAASTRKSKQAPTRKSGPLERGNGSSSNSSSSNGSSSSTPTQAAAALADYLREGGSFGSAAHPSAAVGHAQRAIGLKVDGIVGPKLRRATRALGVILPLRPSTRAAMARVNEGGQS